jgi:putative heme-binding domain-containing protein
MRITLSFVILFLFPVLALAQRDAGVPDPDPELERKTFQVADGFEVNLFAADPLLAKPIQMNFDAAGRLWIASSEAYPQIKPGAKANDKIIILEDTKGAGKADKTTVFMDGLLIPTGLEPGDGGVYVANSTELLHVTEKNGKADKVRVLLSGFGTEDTHHIIHTFRWGHDGLLYFNQSIYIHSHIETPYGPRRLNAGGIWAFRPETMQLEVFARGWINAWGHTFDKWGQSFVIDGAGGEGINYCIPGGYYPAAIGPHAGRILHGLNPGHPKYCGAEIVSGRHLPDDWQGNIITNDFRGHRVCRFVLKDDGTGFAAVQMPDLIKSTHPAFRPIDVKMGPDGAIYIADWYNPIIQHGEVDFRDPRRDVTHGRIWRVTAKGRPQVERPKLVGATVFELLEHQKDPEQWTRHFAKRVLKERGRKEVLPALEKWIARLDRTDHEYEHYRVEALWVYETLAAKNVDLASKLLTAKEPRAQAASVRVLGNWLAQEPDEIAALLIAEASTSDHPRVRLEATRAFGMARLGEFSRAAFVALDKPMDQWLDYALWLTARELEPYWGPQVREGRNPFSNVKHLIFALQAVDSGGSVPALVKLIQSGKVQPGEEADLFALLAKLGGPNELTLVFDKAQADETARPALLPALEQAARERKVKPAGDLMRIEPLLMSKDEETRIAAVKLIGAWKLERLLSKVADFIHYDAPRPLKQATMTAVAEIGGPAAKIILGNEAKQSTDPAIRRMAIAALAGIDLEMSAKLAATFLESNPPAEDVAEATSAFVQRKNGADTLAKALSDTKLAADVAKVALRTMRAGGREVPALTAALNKAGNLTTVRRVLSDAEMKQMVEDVRKQGDPARGEAVYRRKDMACQKCHTIAGAGGLVGPDLISIGASAQIDYLIDSLLLPNKQVKEGYHALKVDLKDGLQITGVKVRENDKELVLRDGEDREIVIPQSKIEDKTIGGSIMPEGLVDPLTRGELLDLTRFLSELGKVGGPYAVGPARVVRRWQVLEPTQEAYTALYRIGTHAPAVDPSLSWSSAYSTVAGQLPLDDLPKFVLKRSLEKAETPFSFARFQIEVTTPGPVLLKVNSAQGLSLWLDGRSIELKDTVALDLNAGLHQVTFAADLSKRKEGLQVELTDAPGSPVQARIIGGK